MVQITVSTKAEPEYLSQKVLLLLQLLSYVLSFSTPSPKYLLCPFLVWCQGQSLHPRLLGGRRDILKQDQHHWRPLEKGIGVGYRSKVKCIGLGEFAGWGKKKTHENNLGRYIEQSPVHTPLSSILSTSFLSNLNHSHSFIHLFYWLYPLRPRSPFLMLQTRVFKITLP